MWQIPKKVKVRKHKQLLWEIKGTLQTGFLEYILAAMIQSPYFFMNGHTENAISMQAIFDVGSFILIQKRAQSRYKIDYRLDKLVYVYERSKGQYQ